MLRRQLTGAAARVRRKTVPSLCSTVTSGGRPSCTHKRHTALLWARELLENAAWTGLDAACRRSPALLGQATAALDSLEPWRSEVAEQLLGGEPVVRQALDAYLRWELCSCPFIKVSNAGRVHPVSLSD